MGSDQPRFSNRMKLTLPHPVQRTRDALLPDALYLTPPISQIEFAAWQRGQVAAHARESASASARIFGDMNLRMRSRRLTRASRRL